MLLSFSVSSAFAADEPSDFVTTVESTSASSVSVQRLSVVPEPLPFGFEIISVGRDTVTVGFVSESRVSAPPYVGEKGTKTAAEKTGNQQYVLEYDKAYSFAYTVTEGENEIVYNSFVTVEQGGQPEVVFGEVIKNIVPSGQSRGAGTSYEIESNDTMFSADFTYDDYDNYGTISSEDDVDWWVVEFDQDGWANFWVGEIPAGCDYDILLYDEDCQGTAIDWLEESINPDQTPELIQWEVEAGVYYYVRIASYEGYSSTDEYLFRAKYYPTHPDDWEPETEEPETEPEVPSDAFGFRVIDSAGDPIEDARIFIYPEKHTSLLINGVSMPIPTPVYTDEDGYAIVEDITMLYHKNTSITRTHAINDSFEYGVNIVTPTTGVRYAQYSFPESIYPSTELITVVLSEASNYPTFVSPYGTATVTPASYLRSQNWGWRYDGVAAELEFHTAVDISIVNGYSNNGEAVYSASDGEVKKSGFEALCGYRVQVLYDDQYYVTYMHLENTGRPSVGDELVAGVSQIGYTGGTYLSDKDLSPHLHISVSTNSSVYPSYSEYFIDPLALIKAWSLTVN